MTTNTDAETNGTTATDARVIVTGPDEYGLGDALETRGATVTRIPGIVNGDALEDAGIDAASILVLTDLGEASAIPVAKEHNPAIHAVSYSHQSLPEYAKAQADLAVDPDLLSPDVVAEELLA